MSELSLEEKLSYFRRKVELYQTMSVNDRFYLYEDQATNESGVFMDRTGSGFLAALHNETTWAFIPCHLLVVKIDERYEDNIQGGGSFGKSLAGGLLFGTTGAVVGGAGRGAQVGKLTTLNVNCYYRNDMKYTPDISIKLVRHRVDTRSMEYEKVKDWAFSFVERVQSHGAVYGGEERKNI